MGDGFSRVRAALAVLPPPDSAEVVAGALNRLDKVKKVTPESQEDGWTRFTVWVDSGTDSRERISRLCSQYGWPLRSLFRHIATLEDVFVELTRRD